MKPIKSPKPVFRKPIKKRRVVDAFANWLQTSSSKMVLVAVLTSIAFLAGLVSAGWTAYKEYRRSKAEVVLHIAMMELGARVYVLTARQMAGLPGPTDKNDPLSQIGAEVPTFNIAFDIINPTDQRVTLTDCTLSVRHKGQADVAQSSRSMTLNAILNRQVEGSIPILVEANSAAHIERVFVFNQANKDKYSDMNLNGKREFRLSCIDQNQHVFNTEWSGSFLDF